jgi:hypothetical protein
LTALLDRLTSRPVGALLALAGVVASVLIGKDGLDTVVGCGITNDARASQSAKDWTGQADHVVVATPTAEQDTGRRDFAAGAIEYRTDRKVTFRADDVLWSAKTPQRPLGKDFTLVAAGWQVYRESGTRVKRTTPAAPRLETGHTYLLALRWTDDQWTVLGEGAAVPFDDRTVAQGEWCGRVLSKEEIAQAERFSRSGDTSLEKVLAGQDEQAVKRELRAAAGKRR